MPRRTLRGGSAGGGLVRLFLPRHPKAAVVVLFLQSTYKNRLCCGVAPFSFKSTKEDPIVVVSVTLPPPPPACCSFGEIKIKRITRRIHMSRRYAGRRYAGGLGPSRVRTRIPTTRRLGQWVSLRKLLRFRVRLQLFDTMKRFCLYSQCSHLSL